MEERCLSGLSSWQQSKDTANVIVTGLLGSGKSALINALFGKAITLEQDTSESKEKVKKGEKHIVKYDSKTLNVWDTCGFCEMDDPKFEETLKPWANIRCVKNGEKFTLLYTISLQKTRFEKNSPDIKLIKKLIEKFGSKVWDHAIIVLTFANLQYELWSMKYNGEDADKRKDYLGGIYKEWVDTIHRLLCDTKISQEQANTIAIVPAGYLCDVDAESLEFDSKGNSWLLDIWQKLALAAPMKDKPILLDICINKAFSASYFYSGSFLSLAEIYSDIYSKKALKLCPQGWIGTAYSFLHLFFYWLHNDITERTISMTCESHRNDISYWKNLSRSASILVTGAESSGKTSLINSMIHGNQCHQEWAGANCVAEAKHQQVACTMRDARLDCITGDDVGTISLAILCIKLSEPVPSLTRILRSFTEKVHTNMLIALTYANSSVYEEPLDAVVDQQASTIRRILKDKTSMNDEVIEGVKIVPAGYHTEMIMRDDLSNKHWALHLWLHAILAANSISQPAMLVVLNHKISKCLYARKHSKSKALYAKTFLDTITKIVRSQGLYASHLEQ